jgi:aminomethyltransferase
MKQTVLHQKHLQLKAKMTEFLGWQIPFQYTDVQEEYQAVRTAVGLFDVGYLGRVEISGPGAPTLLQKVFTRNTSKIAEGTAHYGFLCNESGFVLDDAVLFRLSNSQSGGRYLLSTNAGNADKVILWLQRHATDDVQITDNTLATAQLALQGPHSSLILERLSGPHLKKFKPRAIREMTIADQPVIVSRSGYTGELGYELFVDANRAENLWDSVLEAGQQAGIRPCGLGSRDLLRLEMGYLLYGYDIDETRTPLEAGLLSFIDFKKDFIGKDALLKIKNEGVKQKLAGFLLLQKGLPRHGGSIFSENREIGVVTSGNQSPRFRNGFGLGYVVSRYAQPGQEIEIEVRDREIAAKIVELPFYKKK